jgi:phospholipase C
MLVISPYTKPGYISHTYTDHVSILKFIERNWSLQPLSGRSLDNLPNPVTRGGNAYVPTNAPAIGNLFDLFDFGNSQGGNGNDQGGNGGNQGGQGSGQSDG